MSRPAGGTAAIQARPAVVGPPAYRVWPAGQECGALTHLGLQPLPTNTDVTCGPTCISTPPWPSRHEAEILGRARAAADELVAHGTTAIRSHVDIGPGIELRAVNWLPALRGELAGRADYRSSRCRRRRCSASSSSTRRRCGWRSSSRSSSNTAFGAAPSRARGLTALRALLDAGATRAAGADNVRDPFNRVGRADALETAALLIMAGHLTPVEAYAAVSSGARAAMGLPAVTLTPGSPAEVLAVRGGSLVDAIARSSDDRVVVHAGRVVSQSGGMRMRALARALTLQPATFLFDEPFGALDEITRERLNDELLALFERERFAGLFITHSISEAVFLSTRVLVMSARPGRIVGDYRIDFDNPRRPELRLEPEFAKLCGRVSDALRRAFS